MFLHFPLRSEVSESHADKRRTIQLGDGSIVNEEEAAPVIIQKARDLLRSDLAYVYGTNVVIMSQDKDHEHSPSVPVSELTVRTVPSETERLEMEKDVEEGYKCDKGSKISTIDESFKGSISTKIYGGLSLNSPCQAVMEYEEKRVVGETDAVPAVLCSPVVHSVDQKETESIATRCSWPAVDDKQCHFKHSKFKRPAALQLVDAGTPSIKRREMSDNESSTSFFQMEETFVLTTQLAALVDNVRPDISGSVLPLEESGTSESDYAANVADAVDFVPLSTFDYEMNDTLTLSMLDNAYDCYSIHVSVYPYPCEIVTLFFVDVLSRI